MQFKYGKFDGQPFPTPDMLFPSREVVQFILQYGKEALDAMSHLSQEDQQQYIEALIAAGLLERDEETGELHMTPKMVHAIEHESLLEIFEDMKQGTRDGHPTAASGRNDERTDGTKPYEFGDAISQIDLGATMRNALHHARKNNWQPGPAPGSAARSTPGCARIPIARDDFELHQTEGLADAAVCLLLDLSGSMMRFGRFYYAKQVALGLASLMRDRYPLDTIDFIGFSSVAEPIREMELPLTMPKPVTIFDHEVRMRVPLEQAVQQPGNIPQHFTNLHMGRVEQTDFHHHRRPTDGAHRIQPGRRIGNALPALPTVGANVDDHTQRGAALPAAGHSPCYICADRRLLGDGLGRLC